MTMKMENEILAQKLMVLWKQFMYQVMNLSNQTTTLNDLGGDGFMIIQQLIETKWGFII